MYSIFVCIGLQQAPLGCYWLWEDRVVAPGLAIHATGEQHAHRVPNVASYASSAVALLSIAVTSSSSVIAWRARRNLQQACPRLQI